jgi:hypothetical protein
MRQFNPCNAGAIHRGHRLANPARPKSADFVAEIGMQTARDGWCHF